MRNVSSHNRSTLRQQQLAFSACIRDPLNSPDIEGITVERMTVYRELFYNNFNETLSSAFPVLRQVLDAEIWQQLCQRFFAQYHCTTPYLSRMPGEFVDFLWQANINDPPWLLELARWEWAELDLMLASDPEIHTVLQNDVMNGVPLLTPLLRLHVFDFPVQRICAAYLPTLPGAQKNYLAAWRKPDDTIAFMQLNAFGYQLIQLLMRNQKQTGFELLNKIANEQAEYDVSVIVRGGVETMQSLYQKNILLGALPLRGKDKHYA